MYFVKFTIVIINFEVGTEFFKFFVMSNHHWVILLESVYRIIGLPTISLVAVLPLLSNLQGINFFW